jgi:hypothetical protein
VQLTPVKEVLFRNRCAKRMLPPFDDMNLYEPPAELPRCKCGGRIRPHLCSFGEVPFELDWIYEELDTCTLFVSVGTSGVVETAASFVANVECADNPAGTGGACERILVHGMLLGQSGRFAYSAVVSFRARIRKACVGCAMAKGVPYERSQTCEPWRASLSIHLV